MQIEFLLFLCTVGVVSERIESKVSKTEPLKRLLTSGGDS